MKRILGVLVLCLAGTGAFAADVHWTNVAASSGDFNLASNWENATLPTSTDGAQWFGWTGLHQYSVTLNLSDNAAIKYWEQDYWANSIDVNLNGNTLTGLGGMWGVMAYGATLGTTNRIFGGGTLNVWQVLVGTSGSYATSPLFEIYGAGTVVTTTTGMASFGNNTRAFIRDGAKLFAGGDGWATATIGQGASSSTDPMNAVVTLSGAGTRWENNGILVVGYVKGDGLLSVTNGGTFKGYGNINLGGWQYLYNPLADHKATGTIRVTGSGSSFETTGRVDAGLLTTGRVESVQGGSFTAPSMRLGVGYSDWQAGNISTYGGTNVNAYGSALADELGLIDVRGDVTVGVLGKGDVTAANNGEIYIGGNLDVNTGGKVTVSDGYIQAGMSEMSGSLLRLELGAKDQTAYYLSLSGGLTLGDVNLEIDLLGNFSASLGDTINLLAYGSLDGSFNGWTDGATFTRNDYEFTYNQKDFDTYLTVTAIPEPASILLLASGIVAAFKLRRRA